MANLKPSGAQIRQVKNLDPHPDVWKWQDDAVCKTTDPEIFFLEPNERGETKINHYSAAIAVCNTCPVKQQCLEHALKVPEEFGVWGGTTPEERKVINVRIRRNRRAVVNPDDSTIA